MENHIVKVGSRKSELALIQTRHVISLLKEIYPEKEYRIVTMTTLGDRVINVSLPKIGEKSLFTKDLEDALHNGSVDFVVHSLKDLPTTLPGDLAIGAVLEREDPGDAVVLREDFRGHTLETLPPGSIIGTSSLRRTAQLSRNYPHLCVMDIRGNLNTRLRKLDANCQLSQNRNQNNTNASKSSPESQNPENFDQSPSEPRPNEKRFLNLVESNIPNYVAIILAQAGLVRMGWQHRISQVLSCNEVLYAVGQGALAIECRANTEILQMLAPLNHIGTYCRILAERSFLRTLGGGCSAPVAVSTTFADENSTEDEPKKKFTLMGAVWSLNGETEIQDSLTQIFDTESFNNQSAASENKNKGTKRKLLGYSTGIHLDKPDSKVFKIDSSCRQATDKTNSQQTVNCCRLTRMNLSMNKGEPVDIENLINIHGKLFVSCPFSEVEGVCPVEFPIGQEVMGECPYLSEKEDDFTKTLIKMHPRKSSYDIKKCPFMTNQVVSTNTTVQVSSATETTATMPPFEAQSELNSKNCPFLKLNTISTINSDAELNTVKEKHSSITESSCGSIESSCGSIESSCGSIESSCGSMKIEDRSNYIKLYCGLAKHFEIPEELIQEFEDLGKQLAHKLISHGALEVMKCAHDYIRSTIPQSAPITSK